MAYKKNAETGRRKDAELDALRLDLLVDDRVIVEVKATENILKVRSAQVLTYLRLSKRKLA